MSQPFSSTIVALAPGPERCITSPSQCHFSMPPGKASFSPASSAGRTSFMDDFVVATSMVRSLMGGKLPQVPTPLPHTCYASQVSHVIAPKVTPEPGPLPPTHPHHWRSRLRNLLLAGLLILAPVYLTIYVLVLLFRFMDGIFAPLIDRTVGTFIGERGIHIPGLGILLTLIVILFLGWLSRQVLGR